MSIERIAPPGPQIGAGRIRVDAARAIAKLRDYQLANPFAWVLEVIRAAVASRATAIELRGDASNVWLTWDGAPWPDDDLAHLFDELVSPQAAADRQRVRLLAAGVNSALGTAPAYVDVVAIETPAFARCARYTPDVRGDASAELGDAAAHRVSVESMAAPPHARVGMMIDLHRPVMFASVRALLGGAEPEELELARAACADIAVPLRIGADVLGRAQATADVVRVPLGDGIDGWLAVVDPSAPGATGVQLPIVDVAEHGVVIVRFPLDIELGYSATHGRVAMRVFVDAERMPTNVSRSQVRRDRHPVATAMSRGAELGTAALDALRAQLAATGAPHVPSPARTAALALIGAATSGAGWALAAAALTGPLRALAELPLLVDATGAAHPVTAGWSEVVHDGRDAADPELGPWLANVAWIPPGDAAAALLGDAPIDARACRRRIRWARRQRRAHRKFFAHAPRAAIVDGREVPRLRATLGAPLAGSCVPDAVFDGLAGEIVLYGERGRTELSELVVLLDGRELERLTLDSPTRFAAVIDARALTPAEGFRGVVRDTHYWIVDRAMRAGVLRAIEALAIALGGGELPRGFALPAPAVADAAADARLVRDGLALACALREPSTPLLAARPAWPTVDGRFVSLAELAAVHEPRAIGVAPQGEVVSAVPGRIVIIANATQRALLARLLPDLRLVAYSAARGAVASPRELAVRVARQTGIALAIRDGAIAAAIGPGGPGRLSLRHAGIPLQVLAYAAHYAPCTIDLDSPAIVPADDWQAIADDRGLATRDFFDWERALARAIARAIIGDRDPDLVDADGGTRGAISVTDDVGRRLCEALTTEHADRPEVILGRELAARVCACPLFQLRGEPGVHSIDELVARFDTDIWYAASDGDPIPGMPAVIASELTARVIGALAHRAVGDAVVVGQWRRETGIRADRLAAHRAAAIAPLAVADDTLTVPLASTHLTGIVGVSRGTCELALSVDGRPFTRLVARAVGVELPLCAAIDLPADAADRSFAAIKPEIVAALRIKLLATVPALLRAIAAERPLTLATPGPARTLFATWLRTHEMDDDLRHALRAAPAFATVRGDHVSIEAAEAHGAVACACWHDDWVPAGDDPPSALDGAVLQLPSTADELVEIIDALCDARTDVAAEIDRLQYARRAARGLVAAPTLSGIAAELKRPLAALGAAGRALGLGELGLMDVDRSTALLYTRGVLVRTIPLDVSPSVTLVVDANELIERPGDNAISHAIAEVTETSLPGRLREATQALTAALVRALAAAPATLPPGIARRLFAAAITGALAGDDLGTLAVVETLDGGWTTWAAVREQLAQFPELWLASADTPGELTPLDDRRRVFRMPSLLRDRDGATAIRYLDASTELAHDAAVRRNRARPPATSLRIEARDGVLAVVTLPGDGVTSPRGEVGVLAPHAAAGRELRAHRALHPFDPVADPCAWPTIAVIDDARLTPDRTWTHADPTGAWAHVLVEVRAASERALASACKPPPEAVVVETIIHDVDDPPLHVRGALWLMPIRRDQPTTIALTTARGGGAVTTARFDSLAGALVAYTADGDEPPSPAAIDAVCVAVHRRLIAAVIDRRECAGAAAHVAYALAVRHIAIADAGDLRFACFAPTPLDAAGLIALLAASTSVPVYDQPRDAAGAELAVIDDRGELATIVLAQLGARAYRARAAPPVPAAGAAPPAAHVLDPVVDALRDRLVAIGLGRRDLAIARRATPIASHDGATLWLAGDDRRLHAVASALAVGSPWAPSAIDAVVAHLICVLNLALTDVTDAVEVHGLSTLLRDPA